MSDLKQRFETAAEDVKKLSAKPSNEKLLELYGLFKQATEGDCEGARPGMFNLKARAKFDAWADREGMSSDDAMEAYVKLVGELQAADG